VLVIAPAPVRAEAIWGSGPKPGAAG
jgi:hypothetical protein